MADCRKLGKLVDTVSGKQVCCCRCDRGAIIRWHGEPLCTYHFMTDDERHLAACSRQGHRARGSAP